MKAVFILLFCTVGHLAIAQTKIRLQKPLQPKQDYIYIDPSDTSFVTVDHSEDMGQWGSLNFYLKLNVPDGEYLVYLNDTIALKAFVKKSLRDSVWNWYLDGILNTKTTYLNGKITDEINYYNSGKIFNRNFYENGIWVSSISYYESGYIMTKQNGNEPIKEEFPDSSKFRVVPKKSPWQTPERKIGYNLSYSYQTQSVLEIGISKYHKYKLGKKKHDVFSSRTYIKDCWSSGVSLNFVLANRFIFAPKLFTNLGYKFLSVQLNLSAYSDFKDIEPVFTPEIGVGKFIGIRYGYNFKLLHKAFPEMGNHRLTVFFNLYFPGFKHTT